jgi:hypothetical protein
MFLQACALPLRPKNHSSEAANQTQKPFQEVTVQKRSITRCNCRHASPLQSPPESMQSGAAVKFQIMQSGTAGNYTHLQQRSPPNKPP